MREEADKLRIEKIVKEQEAAKAEKRAELAQKQAKYSQNYLKMNHEKIKMLESAIAKNAQKKKEE